MAAGSSPGGGDGPDEVRRFLDEAFRGHVIDETTYLRLVVALEHREAVREAFGREPATGAAPPPTAWPAPPPTARPAWPSPPAEAPAVPRPRAPAPTHPSWWREPEPPPERPAWAEWLARVRDLVSSDLALHGLAYLGVLLVFVGVFGFVVFAYGELDRSLRPVAEAAIPLSCFLAAWFLRQRRAPHVAVGLELLGGLTLPLVAYASLVDGAPVPPDLTGGALIVALAVVSFAICACYALWSVRHPESILRFLVPFMAWMIVWALGLSFAEGDVVGDAIRHPNPWQMAAFTSAVTISLAFARVFPRWRFASATVGAAIVALPLGYCLGLAIGFEEGWSAGPVAVCGVATVIGIDLLAAGARDRVAIGSRIAQSLVVAFSVAALVPDLEIGWSGAAVTIAAIGLLERWERGQAGRIEGSVALAELAAGLAMASQEPWAMVVGFGAASVWVHVRRVLGLRILGLPPPARREPRSVAELAAALLPLGIGVGLWDALGAEACLFVSGLVLLAAAAAYTFVGMEAFASAWLVGSAAIVDGLIVIPWLQDGPSSTLLVASILAAGVVLAGAPRGVPRLWLGAASLAWAGLLAMDLAELDPMTKAVLASAAGLVTVLVGALQRRETGVALHMESIGQIVSGAALASVALTPGGGRLACLAMWTLGWTFVVVTGELREPAPTTLGRTSRLVPPVLLLVSLPVLASDAARAAGLPEDRPALIGVVVSLVALLEAAVSRAIATRRPLAPIGAVGSFATAVVAIAGTMDDRWSLIVSCAALIGVVVLIPARLRLEAMEWSAWVASAALTLLLSERAGLPTDLLYAAGFGWSTVVLLGGLGLDERLAGTRTEHAWIRTPRLVPPVVLGAVGLAVSLGSTLVEPPSVYGWWMLGGSAVSLAAALMLREASLSGISWALLAFGGASLARDLVLDDPWVLTATAAVVLAASWAIGRVTGTPILGAEASPLARWDLPPFVVAHAVAVAGLARAAWIEEIAPTWLGTAALSLAVAAVVRGWPWAVGGAILAAVGAWDLGPAPLAAALAAESLGVGVAASRAELRLRLRLQFAAAALAAGSWTQVAEAAGWGTEDALRATAIASGLVLLAAAGAIRGRLLAPDWLPAAAALGTAGIFAVSVGIHAPQGPADDPTLDLALAASLAMVALAAAISAAPTARFRLREMAGVLAVAALGELLLGLEVPAGVAVGVLVSCSVITLVVALALWRVGVWRSWAPAIGVFGALAVAAALALAPTLLPDRAPLVAALLASGVELAAAGVVLRRAGPLIAAPLLLMGAWIAFASEAFAGNPQWFTVPIGLAALAVVEVIRWDHRRRGMPVRTPELVALEIAGIVFLVGTSPIRVVQGLTWAGLVGVVLGVLVAIWGTLTRVRRRLWLGVAATVCCLLLMVLVPLAQELPDAASAVPWLLLGAVGVAVVAIATALERGRTRLRAALHHIGELLDGWE